MRKGVIEMSCPIDHTTEEVRAKLEEQKPYLPMEICEGAKRMLDIDQPQERLNELFHLLKKYDLADKEEQLKRNNELHEMFKE